MRCKALGSDRGGVYGIYAAQGKRRATQQMAYRRKSGDRGDFAQALRARLVARALPVHARAGRHHGEEHS